MAFFRTPYLHARTAAVVLQWRVDRDTTAHHRSSILGLNTLWNLDDEVARSTVVGCVTTHGLAGLGLLVDGTVCVDGV